MYHLAKVRSVHQSAEAFRARLLCEVFAELIKEDDATTVPVHTVEVLPRFSLGHLGADDAEEFLELSETQAPVMVGVLTCEEPEELVEVEEVAQQCFEFALLHPIVVLDTAHGGLVGTHKSRLVVEQWVALHHELVDLGQRHDVVAVEVEMAPELPQLPCVFDERFDAALKLVELRQRLAPDEVRVCGPAAVAGLHHLAAALT
mmetsp:Transcript_47967/g.111217  ORF Transcript_47967/g.111217 Transcript_47967/m.111217 type:complete len:203 (+) Transcript_47967:58-666(+)